MRGEYHNSSDAMAALLHPNHSITSKQQQRGTPPINYQLRNRQRIKEIQRQYQCEAQSNIERELQDQRLAHKKLHRFGSIPSRLHSADIKRTEERNCAIYRDDAKKNDATKSNGRMRDVKVDKAISPPKSRAIGKGRVNDEHGRSDASRRESAEFKPNVSKTFGKIPSYLVRRRLEWAREDEERRKNQKDPECPPGMIRLEEAERLRTLQLLRNGQATLQKNMTLLPLRLETLGQKQRKSDLEQKLQEIENAISVFDQKKVFVTNEMIQKYKDKAHPYSFKQNGAEVDTRHDGKLDTRNTTEALSRAHNDLAFHRKHIAGAAA
uniref:Uncharacterized protein AlNc14C242G9489 n=1 Tax=Albugo laibachii Nc14 TaxID=890382 RepID=F0WSZ9_9STRA|nr:conserved hypothetical protein [Albugo laibachii Nc14]|eukprot:CCA24484.1 conserved hypothetical protein [Albugo laibachii Nc14]